MVFACGLDDDGLVVPPEAAAVGPRPCCPAWQCRADDPVDTELLKSAEEAFAIDHCHRQRHTTTGRGLKWLRVHRNTHQGRLAGRKARRPADRGDRWTGRQADKQTGRQPYRQTDRQTGRQADR